MCFTCTLQAFCNDRGLTVNLSKTELVVFQHQYVLVQPSLTYDGTPVEQVDSYNFLGLQLHGTKGLSFTLSTLRAAAQEQASRCWLDAQTGHHSHSPQAQAL